MTKKEKQGKPALEPYRRVASEGRPLVPDPLERAKALGYSEEELGGVPQEAVQMGMGCGNPVALAALKSGQVVLDLGSGGGLDAFFAARKVGPQGKVIGVDATSEMVRKARAFAAKGGYENVDFRVGRMEKLPVAEESVDVIISNCVINHAPDKVAVFREAFRVLRPRGRMFIAELTLEGPPPAPDSPGLEIWKEWLATASGKQVYLRAMRAAGFKEVAVLVERPYTGPALAEALAGQIVSLQLKARK